MSCGRLTGAWGYREGWPCLGLGSRAGRVRCGSTSALLALRRSGGKFGYSVQKGVWLANRRNWQKFFKAIDWVVGEDNNYRQWPTEFKYTVDAKRGHLPLTAALRGTQLHQSIMEHPAFEAKKPTVRRLGAVRLATGGGWHQGSWSPTSSGAGGSCVADWASSPGMNTYGGAELLLCQLDLLTHCSRFPCWISRRATRKVPELLLSDWCPQLSS